MSGQTSPKEPSSRGNEILYQLMKGESESYGRRSPEKDSDTFNRLRDLKEMFHKGEISREEYDNLKLELLLR